MQMRYRKGNTNTASLSTKTRPLSEDAAKTMLTQVTLVVVGRFPFVPVESSPGPASVLSAFFRAKGATYCQI
jgi:hypothetical protein